MQIVYESSPVHRKEPGKRPFTIRFEPKGVSIQTKRGTYSHKNAREARGYTSTLRNEEPRILVNE